MLYVVTKLSMMKWASGRLVYIYLVSLLQYMQYVDVRISLIFREQAWADKLVAVPRADDRDEYWDMPALYPMPELEWIQ
jgi:hypothetical protein